MKAMATAAPSVPKPRRVLRHHWLVRLTHWLNAIAIIVLLIFLVIMNVTAIILRRKFERRW